MNTDIPRHYSAFRGELDKMYGFKKGFRFLDLTLGDGGHTEEALDADCVVVSFDVDSQSISRATEYLSHKYKPLLIDDISTIEKNFSSDNQWIIVHSNFVNAKEVVEKLNLSLFDGILVDLGPSQYQVLSEDRGFSFNSGSPLDMRIDTNLAVTAKDLLAVLNEGELRELFDLADESYSRVIAREIVRERLKSPITTGKELATLVSRIKHTGKGKIHPATQTFMALRMAVNLERENIQSIINQSPDLLSAGGKIGIISFHSGEDLIVKSMFKKLAEQNILSVITKKPISPTRQELLESTRTRSAKIRIAQKHI